MVHNGLGNLLPGFVHQIGSLRSLVDVAYNSLHNLGSAPFILLYLDVIHRLPNDAVEVPVDSLQDLLLAHLPAALVRGAMVAYFQNKYVKNCCLAFKKTSLKL